MAKRRALLASLALVLLLRATSPGHAFVPILVNPNAPPPLPASTPLCPIPIRWNLSPSFGQVPVSLYTGTDSRTHAGSVSSNIHCAAGSGQQCFSAVQSVVNESFATWAGIANINPNVDPRKPLGKPNATIPLTLPGTQANLCDFKVNGITTLCFNPSAAISFPNGVLAFTVPVFSGGAGTVISSGSCAAGGRCSAQFAGELVDADIMFSPSFIYTAATGTTPPQPGQFDLETVAVHEIGHLYGLDHPPFQAAKMFAFAPGPGEFDRGITSDDKAGMLEIYHDATPLATGSIRGKIHSPFNPDDTLNASPFTGFPIFGAHVFAVRASTGEYEVGTIGGWSCTLGDPDPSNVDPNNLFSIDGSYEIRGLKTANDYFIYSEPIDGPTFEDNLIFFFCTFGNFLNCPPESNARHPDLDITTRFH